MDAVTKGTALLLAIDLNNRGKARWWAEALGFDVGPGKELVPNKGTLLCWNDKKKTCRINSTSSVPYEKPAVDDDDNSESISNTKRKDIRTGIKEIIAWLWVFWVGRVRLTKKTVTFDFLLWLLKWLKMIVNSFSLLFHLPIDTVILCFNWGRCLSRSSVWQFTYSQSAKWPAHLSNLTPTTKQKGQMWSWELKRTHCWWRKSLIVLLFILNELWMEMSNAWMLNRRKRNRKSKTYISNSRVLYWSLKWSGSEVLLDVERNLNQSAEKQRLRCFFLYIHIHLIDCVVSWITIERTR